MKMKKSLVMGNKVYDLSEFVHPGGDDILKQYFSTAMDAEEAFDSNGHTKKAISMLPALLIGKLSQDLG